MDLIGNDVNYAVTRRSSRRSATIRATGPRSPSAAGRGQAAGTEDRPGLLRLPRRRGRAGAEARTGPRAIDRGPDPGDADQRGGRRASSGGVATPADIDLAMIEGRELPQGPARVGRRDRDPGWRRAARPPAGRSTARTATGRARCSGAWPRPAERSGSTRDRPTPSARRAIVDDMLAQDAFSRVAGRRDRGGGAGRRAPAAWPCARRWSTDSGCAHGGIVVRLGRQRACLRLQHRRERDGEHREQHHATRRRCGRRRADRPWRSEEASSQRLGVLPRAR